MKIRIRFMALVTVLAMVSSFGFMTVDAEVISDSMVGKYLVFGEYRGEPITYKVWGTRDVDNDGIAELLIAPEELITFKAWTADGRADWRTSTLRTWLNSNEQVTTYETGNVPAYSSEPGFLTNFSAEEKSAMVPVTQTTVISEKDSNGVTWNTGGIGWFTHWDTSWPTVYTNERSADDLYHMTTTDTVFIPSLKDMFDFTIPPVWAFVNGITSILTAAGETWENACWTRTACDTDQARFWWADNTVHIKAVNEVAGVRPTFYVKAGLWAYGVGSKSSPYHLRFDQKNPIVGKFINLGKYQNHDVRYMVVGTEDVTNDGTDELLLMSINVLTNMEYVDATDTGSWSDSYVRTWLNNTGDDGFMSSLNMSDLQKAAIVPVTHKNTLHIDQQSSKVTSGTEQFAMAGNATADQAYGNRDAAYSELTTDSVFIPSFYEAAKYLAYAKSINNWISFHGTPGPAFTGWTDSENRCYYWVRDSIANNKVGLYYNGYPDNYWIQNNIVDTNTWQHNSCGVRPMLFIDANTKVANAGTMEEPYTVVEGAGITNLAITLGEGTVSISANAYNYSGESKIFNLIVAGYDSTGKQLKVVKVFPLTVKNDSTGIITSGVFADDNSIATYIAYIWNDQSLKPYITKTLLR